MLSLAAAALPPAAAAIAWASGRIDFFAPLWLLGLAALPGFAWLAFKSRSGLPPGVRVASLGLRMIVWTLVVMSLADAQWVRRNDALSVLFLLDHSASVPESVAARELEYVNAAAATKAREDTAGILVFGGNPSVELMPAAALKIDRLHSFVNRGSTDIQAALELAVAAFPPDMARKIVLITDGNENQGSLMDGVRFAAARGVVTDILPVAYDYTREVMVDKLQLPDRVRENETFDLRVHVSALEAAPADLTIFRNSVGVAREKVELKPGRNTFAVSMKIEEPGFYDFTARINADADTLIENNEAGGYVYIRGASRVLFVAPSQLEVRYLAEACRKENIEADVIAPDAFPDSLGGLQNYDCVVLANVGADELGPARMEMLRANVRDLGAGLIMLGGENSFGAGGYENTPIEDALPVTMDIQQKKINPKGALVMILHTCEFPDGNYWAKEISKRAIEAINSQDEAGVLLYTSREEWLFPLQPAANKPALYRKIDGAEPGDMPSFAPTFRMAFDALSKSDTMVRHVIVISDGDPSAPSPQLVKDMAAAGITISTVAINPHSPRDVEIMQYLAQQTGGRYYYARDPTVLPRIFVKEAKVVKRSLIFNQKFQPLLVLSTELTKGVSPDEIPPLLAYVASTPKPRAQVLMTSDNDNKDPILAAWRYGLGKSLAFASDASSNWGKHWVTWEKYGKLWSQLVRWASRTREEGNVAIRTEMDGSRGRLVIDAVDRSGQFVNFLKLYGRMVSPDNRGSELSIRQTAPGRYEAVFDARQTGMNILMVGYQNPRSGAQGFAMTGVSIPYSPEYKTLESNTRLLRKAAAAGGGRLLTGRASEDRVFAAPVKPSRSLRPAWEILMLAALGLFLVDVAVRRVVVTREDASEAWARIRAGLRARPRAFERDAMMSVLLRRKQKTFERASSAAAAKTKVEKVSDSPQAGGFKAGLDKAAEDRSAPTSVDVEKGGFRADVKGSQPAPAQETGGASAPPAAPSDAAGDSYTGRLLAAKKRAQHRPNDAGD